MARSSEALLGHVVTELSAWGRPEAAGISEDERTPAALAALLHLAQQHALLRLVILSTYSIPVKTACTTRIGLTLLSRS